MNNKQVDPKTPFAWRMFKFYLAAAAFSLVYIMGGSNPVTVFCFMLGIFVGLVAAYCLHD